MRVDFDNKWYRETGRENGFNPDNELSKSAVDLARDCAISMKKYMDTLEEYDDEHLHQKLQKEIDRLNNSRIEHMLNALFYAEVMAGLGEGFNQFLIKDQQRKNHLRRR